MKRLINIAILFIFTGMYLSAQAPKREVRSVWLSTVWRLDWPSTTVPAANGTNEATREAARNAQKSGLISVLDKLKAANFNTVFFQVRGMCDAFYNSPYEPWSQYLSSERGADPGWDPLAYLIQEAHTRGIEVHAWLNPYRYSTSAESHGNLPNDYATAYPDWLMDYGSSQKILNPGMPEVRKRITDIVADIITNYDVDGIVFDDYFYMSGTKDVMDDQQFQQYNPNALSRGDWRRENVNQMIKDVQTRINSIKSYVTFGISPAGVAASDINVANKYGVDPSPGSDWQYNGIYSDPLAWLSNGTIDYISPQLYWTIGSTSDYSKLSPWWAKVSNFFGRHFYSSNTSSFSSTELVNEININRDADLSGTTGSVYFRT
ncbi:MAG: family 10 glycosylhydrolase, partial [Lentimicrobiaceae bacterium]